jgi:hypothetical protein
MTVGTVAVRVGREKGNKKGEGERERLLFLQHSFLESPLEHRESVRERERERERERLRGQ